MIRLRRIGIFAVALALFFAVGSALSLVQTGSMVMKMAMANDMGGIASTDAALDICPACKGDAGDAATADCLPLCHLASAAIFLSATERPYVAPFQYEVRVLRSPHAFADGIDPSPPRFFV